MFDLQAYLHIINYMAQIVSAPLPRPSKLGDMEIEPTVLAEPDSSDADSLVSSNDPDDLANEQTWPTEEEMRDSETIAVENGEVLPDAQMGTTPKTVRRIPKGMSEYQAAWIIDDEDDGEQGEEDNGSDAGMKDLEEEMVDMPLHVEGEEMESDKRHSVAFQDLDIDEEEKQCVLLLYTTR